MSALPHRFATRCARAGTRQSGGGGNEPVQPAIGGGLLSFELAGGEAAAARFLDRLKLIIHAVSLGGPETLAIRPAMSTGRHQPQPHSVVGRHRRPEGPLRRSETGARESMNAHRLPRPPISLSPKRRCSPAP